MSNLSPSTLALLRAAKNDAPSKESRNAIWGGVTSGLVTHTPLHITPQGGAGQAGASTAPAAAAATKGLATAAGLTGMKGAFIGALFGSAISIGVATFMLRTKPAPTPQNEISRTASLSAQVGAQGGAQVAAQGAQPNNATPTSVSSPTANQNAASTNATDIDALPISSNAGSTLNSAGSTTPTTNATHAATNTGTSTTDDATKKKSTAAGSQNLSPDDMLSREVALVSQARHDLLVGDAAAALKAARAARSLEARQLEPEEMSLEARALRLLGRDAEATRVESQLRTMYPDQTLGR